MSVLETFCTINDLIDEYGSKELAKLSDLDSADNRTTPILNTNLIQRYIEKASEEIISKLKGSYDFPLFEKSAILNDICVVLTMVKLQRRIHVIKQNSSLSFRSQGVNSTLKKLMTGEIKLTEISTVTPSLIKVSTQNYDFTNNSLKVLRKT